MFSAINWKGKNQDLLAVLVVDGPSTGETLKVMTKLFDYVVPLVRLRMWLVQFRHTFKVINLN